MLSILTLSSYIGLTLWSNAWLGLRNVKARKKGIENLAQKSGAAVSASAGNRQLKDIRLLEKLKRHSQISRLELLLPRRWVRILVLARNSLLVAPDTFLAAVGFLYLVSSMQPISSEDFLSLIHLDSNWIAKVLFVLFTLATLLTAGLLFTFWFARQDPQRLSLILTKNVSTNYSLFYVSKLSREVIKKIKTAEGSNVLIVLSGQTKDLETIELSIRVLAKRFGLTASVFSDQFFLFSPAYFKDRQTKLGLNQIQDLTMDDTEASSTQDSNAGQVENRNHKAESNESKTDHSKKRSEQTDHIIDWTSDRRAHLRRLCSTHINMAQLEALFSAQSTSGAVQRLAYILQRERLPHEDLNLLFRLTGAFRGGFLFRKLLAATVVQTKAHLLAIQRIRENTCEKTEEGTASWNSALDSLEARVNFLIYATKQTEETAEISNDKLATSYYTPYSRNQIPRYYDVALGTAKFERWYELQEPNQLRGWWEELSESMYQTRFTVGHKLAEMLHAWQPNSRLFLIVDKHSRAIRTAIREVLKKDFDNRQVVLFFVTDQNGEVDQGTRLLHDTIQYETEKESFRKSIELQQGSLRLLDTVVQDGDVGAYLIATSALVSEKFVYSRSSPEISARIEETFSRNTTSGNLALNEDVRFRKIALSAAYKLQWSDYFDSLKAQSENCELPDSESAVQAVFGVLTKNGITADSLQLDRDQQTGGLYQHTFTHLISDIDAE